MKFAKIPSIMVAMMWFVHIAKWLFNAEINRMGVYPRTLNGSAGILLSPLIHGDLFHLLANSFPMILLGTALYYGYEKIANKVFVLIYLLTGMLVWLLAREAYHIGASGIVYGLFGFVFSGGMLSKDRSLAVIGLAAFMLYGGVFYGIFPDNPEVSWESHLLGLLVGILLAIMLTKSKPTNTSTDSINANHTVGDSYEIVYDYHNSEQGGTSKQG